MQGAGVTCELLISSPVQAAASLPTSSSVTSPSSPLSGTPTPAKYCASDSPGSESSRAMSEPWTSRESWLASMQSALASLVRTSAQQEKAQALEASAAASIAKSCEQLTLFDLPGSSSKTAHSSEPEAGTSSSPTWWRVDIPGETDSLPRLMSERLTSAIAGGALLPTLTVCGNWNRKGASPTSGDGLATAIRNLPTLCATDWKSAYSLEGYRAQKEKRSKPLRDSLVHEAGIPLTPTFSEWWMGFPIRHTESARSAMHKSRSKRPTPGSRSAARGAQQIEPAA